MRLYLLFLVSSACFPGYSEYCDWILIDDQEKCKLHTYSHFLFMLNFIGKWLFSIRDVRDYGY